MEGYQDVRRFPFHIWWFARLWRSHTKEKNYNRWIVIFHIKIHTLRDLWMFWCPFRTASWTSQPPAFPCSNRSQLPKSWGVLHSKADRGCGWEILHERWWGARVGRVRLKNPELWESRMGLSRRSREHQHSDRVNLGCFCGRGRCTIECWRK